MAKTKKPKVLISTYGDSEFGIGHILRDLELAKFLSNHARIFFHVNRLAITQVANIEYIYDKDLNEALISVVPDILIYDKPYKKGQLPKNIQKNRCKIIALDYFYYQDARVDTIINLENHYKNTDKIAAKKLYSGERFAIIREGILKFRDDSHKIPERVCNILITFGGADPKNNTLKILETLVHIKLHDFKINTIAGPLFKHTDNIFEVGNNYFKKKFKLIKNTKDMGSLMSGADMVFCGGGTTLLEALCLGKTVIVMPQSKDEHDFITKTKLKNCVVLVDRKSTRNQSVENIQRLIDDYQLRKRIAENGFALIDGNGIDRIVKIILQN